MQLDINDKVPRSRLPRGIRPIQIERVLADGTTVIDTVDREVVILYTKITTMPTQDFLDWLQHFADPNIPAERQFYFSAELRRAEQAGERMPVTVQAALAWPPKPDQGVTTASDKVRRSKHPKHDTAPPKKKYNTKAGKAISQSNLSKAKLKRRRESRDQSEDDEDTEEAEDFVLPNSDDSDDLSGTELAAAPTSGTRKSQRIKSGGKSQVQEPRVAADEADPPMPSVDPKGDSRKELSSGMAQKNRDFLSSISITKPARRLPAIFSLSPAVDPLDSSTGSRVSET